MNDPRDIPTRPTPDQLRTWFAGERTLLAWIRTGIAMMGFGFLVARFGLFLREFALIQPAPLPHSPGWSVWIGVAMVLLGAGVNVAAGAMHLQFLREFRPGVPALSGRSWLTLTLPVLLAVLGIGMAAYLVEFRG
ncbi:MAG: DUF202 domain-containing protein [Planctomyces sp.]|nr:DUF202 domain-containing protein [Planctomyces sp.]